MSRALQYAAKCDDCGRPMRPGTVIDFFDDGKGGYRYIHAPHCPSNVAPPVTRRARAEFDAYTCPHCRADWAFDKGAFERGRGRTPACPTCGKPWTELAAALAEVAV